MGTLGIILCLSSVLQLAFGSYNKMLTYRPIKIDDLVTPTDFLLIASKLMEKEGKGIVSSAKSEPQLADKLFQRFYFTNSRFAPVRALDISGLDAIQALALSGDDFQPSNHFAPIERHHFVMGFPQRCRYTLIKRKADNRNGKGHPKKAQTDMKKTEKKTLKTNKVYRKVFANKNTQKSNVEFAKNLKTTIKSDRHKREAVLNSSTISVTRTHFQSNGRRKESNVSQKHHVIPQAKKLLKNRVMVVKTDRKKRDTIVNEDVNIEKARHIIFTTPSGPNKLINYLEYAENNFRKHNHVNLIQLYGNPPLEIDKVKCYWQYKCKNVDILPYTLCDLHPECEGTESDHFIRDDIPTYHKVDEHDERLLHFRQEVGVNLIDEEVEKILEHRYCLLKIKINPIANVMEEKHNQNLRVYFQKLIFAQKQLTTTISPPVKHRKSKNTHRYKFLRKKNSYSDPKVQRKMKEFQQQKERQQKAAAAAAVASKVGAPPKAAVISLTTPITTPLPQFMHVI